MFTGIVAQTTKVLSSRSTPQGLLMVFERPQGWDDLNVGDSVATNGICLTVEKLRKDEYECVIMPETLFVTAFGEHVPGRVNVERPVSAGGRFDGHFVQGHVDAVGEVKDFDESKGYDLYLQFPKEHEDLVVSKGSIAIDGVSLTIAEVEGHTVRVSLIPHTLSCTTLGDLERGSHVNLEYDMLGKYIVKQLEKQLHARS